MRKAEYYDDVPPFPGVTGWAPTVRCITADLGSVEATALLCQCGFRPAVLNFANGYNCGGDFDHGRGTQEEDMFRETSLFLSLWPRRRVDDIAGKGARSSWIGHFDKFLPQRTAFYPLSQCGGIYSPHVRRVCKDSVLAKAEDIASLPAFSVLTVAAQDLTRESFDECVLVEKCRTALWMAVDNGHNAVVLGAFGCGCFRNPPAVVAATFKRLLYGEFAGTFQLAVFPVPNDSNGHDNHAMFASFFPTVLQSELQRLEPDERACHLRLVDVLEGDFNDVRIYAWMPQDDLDDLDGHS